MKGLTISCKEIKCMVVNKNYDQSCELQTGDARINKYRNLTIWEMLLQITENVAGRLK